MRGAVGIIIVAIIVIIVVTIIGIWDRGALGPRSCPAVRRRCALACGPTALAMGGYAAPR